MTSNPAPPPRRRWLILAAVLTTLVLALLTPHLITLARDLRFHHLARQAESRQDWGQASFYRALLLRHRPNDPRRLEAAARAFRHELRFREEELLRARLYQLNPTTTSLLDWAESLIQLGRLDQADRLLQTVQPDQPLSQARLHHLHASLAFQSGDYPRAAALWQDAARLDPSQPVYTVNALSAQAAHATPAELPALLARLQPWLDHPQVHSTARRAWLSLAAHMKNHPPPDFPHLWPRWWDNDPALHLPILDALRTLDPSAYSQRLKEKSHQDPAAMPPAAALAWVRWLADRREFTLALQSLDQWTWEPSGTFGLQQRLTLATVLEQAANPAAVTRWMADTELWQSYQPLQLALTQRYRQLGLLPGTPASFLTPAVRPRLRQDLALATALTDLCFQWRWLPEYRELLLLLAEHHPAAALPALQELTTLELEAGSGQGLWRATRLWLTLEPHNTGVANNHAYLSFLLGREVAAARSLISFLTEREPRNATFATTRALGAALHGSPAEQSAALAELESMGELSAPGTAPGWVRGLLMARLGRSGAQTYLNGGEAQLRLQEERQLLQQTLQALPASSMPPRP